MNNNNNNNNITENTTNHNNLDIETLLNNNLNSVEDVTKALIKYDRDLLQESNLDKVVSEIENYKKIYGKDDSSYDNSEAPLNFFDLIKKIYNDIMNNEDTDKLDPESLTNTLQNYISETGMDIAPIVSNEKVKELVNVIKKESNLTIKAGDKPLGEFGEYTINECFNKIATMDFSFIINNMHVSVYPIKLATAGLIYGGLIRYYIKNSSVYKTSRYHIKNKQNRISFQRYQYRQLRLFLCVTAPAVTFALMQHKTGITDAVKISFDFSNIMESIFPLLILSSRPWRFINISIAWQYMLSNLFDYRRIRGSIIQGAKFNRGLPTKRLSLRKEMSTWRKKNNNNKFYFFILILIIIILYLLKENSIFIKVFNLLWINKESIILGYCLIGAITGFIFNGINYIVFKVIYLNPNIKINKFKPIFLSSWLLEIINMCKENEAENLITQFKKYLFFYLFLILLVSIYWYLY